MEALKIELPDLAQQHESYVASLIAGSGYEKMADVERFHFERRFGIGGSDIGAILGVNKYRTALDVYLEKRGEAEPFVGNEFTHFGNVLEDIVAQEYARRTNSKVQRRNQPFSCEFEPWLRANIDRHVVGSDRGLECKTADKWAVRSDEWGAGNVYQRTNDAIELVEACDEVPDSYLLQSQHYMSVTGKRVWDLAALIGGNEFRIYTLNHNEELDELVRERCREFWFNHVIPGIPPEPQTLSDLESLYTKDNGASVTATPEIIEKWKRLQQIKAQIKALEIEAYGPVVGGKAIGGLDFDIKRFIGENSELLLDEEGQKLASWKAQSTTRLDSTALKEDEPALYKKYSTKTTFRVLR